MPVRRGQASDLAAARSLFQASPLVGIVDPPTLADITRPNAGTAVNINGGGTLVAAVLAYLDDSSKSPAIYYQMGIGTTLAAIRPCLVAVAQFGVSQFGVAGAYWMMPQEETIHLWTPLPQAQRDALRMFRQYCESRWAYKSADEGAEFRLMTATLANIQAVA